MYYCHRRLWFHWRLFIHNIQGDVRMTLTSTPRSGAVRRRRRPLPVDAAARGLRARDAADGPRVWSGPARPGRLGALCVSLSESGLRGAFVRACRALNSQKRRFPARVVGVCTTKCIHCCKRDGEPALQVRKPPNWPRRWANSSPLDLYSHRNAWASQLVCFGPT